MPRRLRRPRHPARACHRASHSRVRTPTQDVVLRRPSMDTPIRAIPVDPNTMRPGLIRRLTALSIIPANVMGAVTVYFYYNNVDPLGGGPPPDPTQTFLVFLAVTLPLVGINWWLGARWVQPLRTWRRRIRAGIDPHEVPQAIRRRAIN